MKSSFVQPSLSRDFYLLAGVILFVLLLLSAGVAWSSYDDQSNNIMDELQMEADRIDRILEREITNTGYLLNAIGRQLSEGDPKDYHHIAKILQTYNTNNRIFAVWSWADETQHIFVSSNKGIIEEPVDVSDRDYVHKSAFDPWQLQIGAPIEGRVSDRWVIPVSMGVTDDTGKYLGSLTASLDIQSITDEISHLIKRNGISFAIISKTMLKLTEVSETPDFVKTYFPDTILHQINLSSESSGVISKASMFPMRGIYAYYQVSARYPYILLVGYDAQYTKEALERLMFPRLLQIVTLACFLLMFLWIVRVRVIRPVVALADIAAGLTRGVPYERRVKRNAPVEIDMLAGQLARVSDYIDERKRVEGELRDKLETVLSKEHKDNQQEPPFVTE